MSSERVSTIIGQHDSNVILVAPHSADDMHTATIAEECALTLGCHAIINRGFERSDHVDVLQDLADCNKVSHVIQDVVADEFLQPLRMIKERIVNRIVTKARRDPSNILLDPIKIHERAIILFIHGAGDLVHKKAGEQVACIVGNGGVFIKSSLSCEEWRKDAFIHIGRTVFSGDGEMFAADPKGNYAGRSYDNMNQFFRQHEPDKFVETMQLEFPFSMRCNELRAMMTGQRLAKLIRQLLTYTDFNQPMALKTI